MGLSRLIAMDISLPRLFYAADVPVESTLHGSALLYRLLEDYERQQLCIVETGPQVFSPAKRLDGVRYESLAIGRSRWLQTRFNRLASFCLALRAAAQASRLRQLALDFKVESVLTVAHGFGWIAAAGLAKSMNLPLHLIIHDDWPRVDTFPRWAAGWIDRIFGGIYRQAASRLCVSPYMEEEYARRYGVRGTVLYPSRAKDAPRFDGPSSRMTQGGSRFTAAYAGSINSPSYAAAVRAFAECLADLGGELLLFGPLSLGRIHSLGLDLPNVRLCGMVSSAELIERCRSETDVLFVPMSFAPEELGPMMLNFPSKLTDYTAAGVPLLIRGPSDCSAVRWARENPGVAEVVDDETLASLSEVLRRLTSEPNHRLALARKAMEMGDKCFSHAVAARTFHGALAGIMNRRDVEEEQ